jgi:hypothetical protein
MTYGIVNVLAFIGSQNTIFQMITEMELVTCEDPSKGNSESSQYSTSGYNTDASEAGTSSTKASDTSDDETKEELLHDIKRLEEFSLLTLRVAERGYQWRVYDIHKPVQEAFL